MPVPENYRASLPHATPGLARKLGLFDATMLVMGGIVGAGIFMNPSVVARQAHTPLLILGVWALGGLIALAGAFIYAELAARLPVVGGQYAYLREAYHPAVAFLYGWALLLVIQTGGMAAVALTFARYFVELTGASLSDRTIATAALVVLTLINCLGVRAGSALQSALMIMKIMALAALVACGWLLVGTSRATLRPVLDRPVSLDFATSLGAAMVPVLFAYGGWQTANFIAGEVREPRKNLPRGLLLGVGGVIALYLAVNLVCVRALGAQGLAETSTPASQMMRLALGEKGATFIAAGIALSTLGFLSQSILTAPRVYFAMAEDALFFPSVAWVSPRTRVPVVAILLEGGWTIVIALWGRYEQILSYTESIDWLFFGLTATCLFVFRRREAHGREWAGSTTGQRVRSAENLVAYRVPGHPVTTLLFVGVSWLFVANTLFKYPRNAAPALALVLTGVPFYFLWRWRHSRRMSAG
jgi:basic amino acid/polyamine antiporter, APA family